MHVCCVRSPLPVATPTTRAPATTPPDPLVVRGFAGDAMDFADAREKTGGGGARSHDLPGCHPHETSSPPRTSSLAPQTPRSSVVGQEEGGHLPEAIARTSPLTRRPLDAPPRHRPTHTSYQIRSSARAPHCCQIRPPSRRAHLTVARLANMKKCPWAPT
jgi:hypothetical protein